MNSYRDDSRWQEARAAYMAEDFESDADELFVRRIKAATRMHEIETEYAAREMRAPGSTS